MRLIEHKKTKPNAKKLADRLRKDGATRIRILPKDKGFDVVYTMPTPVKGG